MKLVRNLIVAFSLYSQIPMPRFEWQEEDMKHNMVFLPWIGAVIGLVSFGLSHVLGLIELPLICQMALYSLLPLIITGGFHVDGFMDVQDAIRSYKSREEKLEILKDPHIGAFAVIRMGIYALIWIASLSQIVHKDNTSVLHMYFAIFFIARAFSAVSSQCLKHAKKDGMLNMETKDCGKTDFVICVIELLVGIALLALINVWAIIVCVLVLGVYFIYYRSLCYRQFGGVTGDTAGYCITTLEEWLLVAIAIASFFV
ncbi:MAG: adenosylcobinamide-GDP ribazoletransferase [Lachnospiraceae bacterium]|nr:adenosylcobinamide-GDP ribazoletransferase [Candidatus Merdinaster equi]